MSTNSTEIFHEGIRILGLKVIEGGKFHSEVFKTITEQTRDPLLVGLDLKARIAANNVCASRYLKLIDKFGPDFVEAAVRRSSLTRRARRERGFEACRTVFGDHASMGTRQGSVRSPSKLSAP